MAIHIDYLSFLLMGACEMTHKIKSHSPFSAGAGLILSPKNNPIGHLFPLG
jgi:hypothetical protein